MHGIVNKTSDHQEASDEFKVLYLQQYHISFDKALAT
jgi:hypothetical protein